MDTPLATEFFFDQLLVIIVLYKVKLEESAAFISLTEALHSRNSSTTLFVYDNSPLAPAHSSSQTRPWTIAYQDDRRNAGVSKAYNIGFETAKSQNKKWILLTDQDTVFPRDTFDQYQKCLRELNCSVVVPRLIDSMGMASPLKFYLGGGQRLQHVPIGRLLNLTEYFFHNSGLLIASDAFEGAGRYDENLPLDFSDYSFVLRLRARNKVFAVANIAATHHLAATSASNLDERLDRFAAYIKGARYFNRNYHLTGWTFHVRLLLRAIKLTWQYRNSRFLVLYFC
jgi:GT2 family glycosyltransferase